MRISTDQSELDLAFIHQFLTEESTWAQGIPRATVERAVTHSLCFGGYVGSRQIAFARVVSDYATFAYLADVFVVASERGKGHSKALMAAVMGVIPRLARFAALHAGHQHRTWLVRAIRLRRHHKARDFDGTHKPQYLRAGKKSGALKTRPTFSKSTTPRNYDLRF